ncbi:MAG: DUF2119 domain-containing protein [Methanosarcinaceae archaeon]
MEFELMWNRKILNYKHMPNDLKIYENGESNNVEPPIRLFVAGLHGDEWRDTSGILFNITPPKNGTLAVIPIVDNGEYVSTLDDRYYTSVGSKIVDAVKRLHPNIYVELHSYAVNNLAKLTDEERINKTGVPAYIELEDGVLIGSVPPYIRLKHFSIDALCLSFEIQKNSARSKYFAVGMLDVVKKCVSRDEFVKYLEDRFPLQAKIAIENYKRFYGL